MNRFYGVLVTLIAVSLVAGFVFRVPLNLEFSRGGAARCTEQGCTNPTQGECSGDFDCAIGYSCRNPDTNRSRCVLDVAPSEPEPTSNHEGNTRVTRGRVDADRDGWTVGNGDCDDGDPDRFPGNPEVCDGKDNNCNYKSDDGLRLCTVEQEDPLEIKNAERPNGDFIPDVTIQKPLEGIHPDWKAGDNVVVQGITSAKNGIWKVIIGLNGELQCQGMKKTAAATAITIMKWLPYPGTGQFVALAFFEFFPTSWNDGSIKQCVGAAVTNNTFRQQLRLKYGPNTISATTYDRNGHTATDVIYVYAGAPTTQGNQVNPDQVVNSGPKNNSPSSDPELPVTPQISVTGYDPTNRKIQVTYSYSKFSSTDWIAVVPTGSSRWGSPYADEWHYVNGRSGTITLALPRSGRTVDVIYYEKNGFTELTRLSGIVVP